MEKLGYFITGAATAIAGIFVVNIVTKKSKKNRLVDNREIRIYDGEPFVAPDSDIEDLIFHGGGVDMFQRRDGTVIKHTVDGTTVYPPPPENAPEDKDDSDDSGLP